MQHWYQTSTSRQPSGKPLNPGWLPSSARAWPLLSTWRAIIAPPAALAIDIDVLNVVSPFVGATAQSFGHGGGGANRNVVLARGTAKDEPDNLDCWLLKASSGNSTYQRWLGLGRPAEGKRAHLLDSHRHRVAHAVVAGGKR